MTEAGREAAHRSEVGDPRAPDEAILAWARAQGRLVLTQDLDFGTPLALTRAADPSVLQVRGAHVLPEQIGALVVAVLGRFESEHSKGALATVEAARSRVRILPL